MRNRRQDRREDRQQDRSFGRRGSGNNRYQMREKLISIGDDFWIENEHGQKTFKVDGKALRVRQTLKFENAHGNRIALVKKALISPIRDRFTVQIKNGPDLEVKGNILDHEYTIGEGRDKVAEVSKKWFRLRDTYGVEIEPGQDDILILAVTVCIDQMAH